MTTRILVGDCREHMAAMELASVDAIVTDPPYGLSFMGKGWDHGVPGVLFWAEALRVLKPGGHLLAFGGTRTHHRLMVAIEDAGFEIRDCLMWLYGSGFPKSLNVALAIDKADGAVSHRGKAFRTAGAGDREDIQDANGRAGMAYTAPATEAAQQWDGWGTALKPAWEPIVMARKPLGKNTVAANVTQYGTGALNIDGCRIEGETIHTVQGGKNGGGFDVGASDGTRRTIFENTQGRWPANVALDEDAAAMLDAQSGIRPGAASNGKRKGNGYGEGYGAMEQTEAYRDTGGASRFMYCAKASRSERNKGLEGMPERGGGCLEGNADTDNARKIGANPDRPVATTQNHHPTVKPIALMQWLVRMVTPPGGVVLDPFGGSGSTMVAAAREGFDGVYIDLDPDYADIARARIAGDAPLFNGE